MQRIHAHDDRQCSYMSQDLCVSRRVQRRDRRLPRLISPAEHHTGPSSVRTYGVVRPSVVQLPDDVLELLAMALRAEIAPEAAFALVNNVLEVVFE